MNEIRIQSRQTGRYQKHLTDMVDVLMRAQSVFVTDSNVCRIQRDLLYFHGINTDASPSYKIPQPDRIIDFSDPETPVIGMIYGEKKLTGHLLTIKTK